MAFFRPTSTAFIRHRKGRDVYGAPVLQRPYAVPVAAVTFRAGRERSSVRADSSASRGRAEEANADAVLLFPAGVSVANGDIVEFAGERLEVVRVQQRFDMQGSLDHLQVDLQLSQASV
jgi:hypothetical protein